MKSSSVIVKFATQIDQDVLSELKQFAKETDRNISSVVNEAVADYLQKVKLRPTFLNAMDEVLNENEELLHRLAK